MRRAPIKLSPTADVVTPPHGQEEE